MTSRRNVRLDVAYDGTDFRGLAPNPGVRTVVGELQRVLAPLVGSEPEIVMAGRTDAGVHAWCQVLSFHVDVDRAEDLARIQKSVNSRLGPEIVVREIQYVEDDFSARFSASGRHYRYLVSNDATPNPFLARNAWHVPATLDVEAMNQACSHLIGEHDFSSFCRRPKPTVDDHGVEIQASLVRRINKAQWSSTDQLGFDNLLQLEISGTAFCHQMVRSVVGLAVAVGTGKRQAADVPDVLAAKDRAAAENPAPPHGLTLWQVDY